MSKGLEALKELKFNLEDIGYDDNSYLISLCNDIEKELKALEIIKRKDICPTKLYCAKDYETYLWVCEQDEIDKEWILTQEEYDLLNEVFFKYL